MGDDHFFELGDLQLESGVVLRGARIDYRVHGAPNARRDNVVLLPHMYSGSVRSLDGLIGPGRAIDPRRHCVVVPGQLGNGRSTSPSNHGSPEFPEVTVADDVAAQARLVETIAGDRPLLLVAGYSMGAAQAYEWAVRHPARVPRLLVMAGTARTPGSAAFLIAKLTQALRSARPLERHGELWARLGVSAAVYREERWRHAGYGSEEEFKRALFVDDFTGLAPGDLACQLSKWGTGDVSRATGGDLAAALGRIRARVVVMPFKGDPFAPTEVCAAERQLIAGAELRPLDTAWGHYAFGGFDPRDRFEIERAIGDLLTGEERACA